MQNIVRRSTVTIAIIAGFATLGLTAAAVAQAPAPPAAHGAHAAGLKPHRHEDGLAKLAKELKLTDAQKAQIKTLRAGAKSQTEALKKNASLTPDQKKAQLKTIRKDTAKQMAAILTPEQKAKWAQIRAQQKAARAQALGKTAAGGAAPTAPAAKP